jgi:N,N-dimethylformamidase
MSAIDTDHTEHESSLDLLGYTNRFSYQPGETVSLMMSGVGQADVALVRLLHGPHAIRREAEPVEWQAAGSYTLSKQRSSVGSFVIAEEPWQGMVEHFTFCCWFWSTVEDGAPQTLFSTGDEQLAIGTEARDISVTVDGGRERFAAGFALAVRTWYHLEVECGPSSVTLSLRRDQNSPREPPPCFRRQLNQPLRLRPPSFILLGAESLVRLDLHAPVPHGIATKLYNGKLESPLVVRGALSEAERQQVVSGEREAPVDPDRLLAGWSFRLDHAGPCTSVPSIVENGAPATLINLPTRGVTSHSWSGRARSFVEAPAEYSAVHLHSSDLVDAGWTPLIRARLPQGLESGVYGLRVRSGDLEDTVPIAVVPTEGAERERVAVVLPVFSYLAYGNETSFDGVDARLFGYPLRSLRPYDQDRIGVLDFGLSLYDTHTDGSGVVFASWRRPLPNIRHDYSFWAGLGPETAAQFAADMHLIEWMHSQDIACDVLTDLEIHESGAELLQRYSVIVTGHHPEYASERMLDALTSYRDRGGRLVYLGGNGFYWVTEVYSDQPLVVEVRRGHAGVRLWESEPGEVTLVSTGTPGGLWRHRGRAPQRLVEVGMAAQGMDTSVGYKRTQASRNGPYEWIFEGVDEDPVGEYGAGWGGAAGLEVDRVDARLGSSEGAVVLASSLPFSRYYVRAIEELMMTLPCTGDESNDHEVRADLVCCSYPSGGAVFAVGSMTWIDSLLHEGARNGVSRVTANVLRRFLHSEPLM